MHEVRRVCRCAYSPPMWFFALVVLAAPTIEDLAISQAKAENEPSPKDVLKMARRQTSLRVVEGLRSAIGTGTFEHYVQREGDDRPKLWTKATVKMYFDRGKYHLRFDYERKLSPTVYRDRNGQKIKEKLADWKSDDFLVVYDGKAAYNIEFSDRIRPVGCAGEIFSRMSGANSDFPYRFPAQLSRRMVGVDSLRNDSIKMVELPDQGFRGSYRYSPELKFEFDVLREIDFNVASVRAFNKGDELPFMTYQATWKKSKGFWYVNRLAEMHDLRRLNEERWLERSVFEYVNFEVNPKVDQNLFSPLNSVEIPVGTRFLDRRPGAEHRILHFDGSKLSPQRP